MSNALLIVDDNTGSISTVKSLAAGCGFEPILEATSLKEARECWATYHSEIAAVVLDLEIHKKGDGWTLLQEFKQSRRLDDFEVLIYSAHLAEIKLPLEAIRRETVSLFIKFDDEHLMAKRLRIISERFRKDSDTFYFSEEEIARMDEVANSCSPILLIGGPGSGKTVKARELAIRSGCAEDRIMHVNCAGLSSELAENELFGSTKGAYTGSARDMAGKMMLASGFSNADLGRTGKPNSTSPKRFKAYGSDQERWGAVILDEIGSLDLVVQAKILLVIEGEPMQPLGWQKAGFLPNFRVIAATNEMAKLVRPEYFRRDLFDRLSTYVIECRNLSEESIGTITKIIKNLSIPTRLRGMPAPSIRPDFTKTALAELLKRIKNDEMQGGYRALRSIVERSWLSANKNYHGEGQAQITDEDIRKGWEYNVEFYSLLDSLDDTTAATEVAVPTNQQVDEIRVTIAGFLNLEPSALNRKSFTAGIHKTRGQTKQEFDSLLGLSSTHEKDLIYTAIGMALGFRSAGKKQIGSKDYADWVSGTYSSVFSQARKKTNGAQAE